ncbi:unnamed protein product, partial [Ixodes hexagonus]
MVTCHLCMEGERQHYDNIEALQIHLANVHGIDASCSPFCEGICTLQSYTARYEMHLDHCDTEAYDIATLFQRYHDSFSKVFHRFGFSLRFFITLCARMGRFVGDSGNDLQISTHFFHSTVHFVWSSADIKRALQLALAELCNRLESFSEEGSGFFLDWISQVAVSLGRYCPPKVGCDEVVLPPQLSGKRCLLNINKRMRNSERHMCFAFSVLAGLHPAPGYRRQRASSYRKYLSEYHFPSRYPIEFPRDVEAFERHNNVSINVYSLDEQEKYIYPVKVVEQEKEKHVNLFLFNNHFMLITNLNGLFEDSLRFRCTRCLLGCSTASVLEKHTSLCKRHTPSKTIFADDGGKLQFDEIRYMAEVPYFVVYDFESILSPCQTQGGVYEDHIPSSFCIAVVRTSDGRIVKDRLYRGNDCVRKFISAMEDVQADVLNWIYSQEAPIDMQKADQHAYDSATHCNICKEPFSKRIKVRDHDHQTGKYRQALFQACNLKLRTP